MKKIFAILFMLLPLSFVMVGCQKFDEEPDQKSLMTRSANADLTLYYWYKGEKVALTLNNEYVNVLVDKNMRALQANSIFQNYLVQDDSIY